MTQGHTRKLQAILAADVVGYSRLMNRDEEGTLSRLQAQEREVVDPAITGQGGEVVKRLGDGVLAVFPSAVTALRAAREIQTETATRQAGEAQPITYRIGLNVGDVMVTESDIFGDGVNIAARLEGLADPGGIAISAAVHDNVRAQDPGPFDDLGERQVKNIDHPVRVYRVRFDHSPSLPVAAGASRSASRLWLVVGLLAVTSLLAWAFWPATETPEPGTATAPAPVPKPESTPVPVPAAEPVAPVARPAPVTRPAAVATSPSAPPDPVPASTPSTSRNEPAPSGNTGTTDTTGATEPGFSERLFDTIAEAVEEELATGDSGSGSSSNPGKSKKSSNKGKGRGKNK